MTKGSIVMEMAPKALLNNHPDIEGSYYAPIIDEVLCECSTITEAIKWFEIYNCSTSF